MNREEYIKILEEEMEQAAEALDFERAALLRDQLFELKAAAEGRGERARPGEGPWRRNSGRLQRVESRGR